MTNPPANPFQNLLAAWRRRDDARRNGSFAELGQARIVLEQARTQVHAHTFGSR